MKAYLVLAASAIAMAATPALAQTQASGNSSTIAIGATVTAACGVGNHRSGATTGAGDLSAANFNLTSADGSQFRADQTLTRSFGNVWCNGPAKVTVEASQLTTSITGSIDTSSFTNSFDVSVSGGAMVYVGNQTLATSDTNRTVSVSANLPSAFETGLGQYSSVDITVHPKLGSGNQPLRAVAGTYSGHVTISATVS